MQLEETLLRMGTADRVSYDAERNVLFLNLRPSSALPPPILSASCASMLSIILGGRKDAKITPVAVFISVSTVPARKLASTGRLSFLFHNSI